MSQNRTLNNDWRKQMQKLIKWFKDKYYAFKMRKQIKKMREKDPFIYK